MIRRLRVVVLEGTVGAIPETMPFHFANHRSPPPFVLKLGCGGGHVPRFGRVVRGAPLATHVQIASPALDEFALAGHRVALEGNELGCALGLLGAVNQMALATQASKQASIRSMNLLLQKECGSLIKTFLMLHRHRKTTFILNSRMFPTEIRLRAGL